MGEAVVEEAVFSLQRRTERILTGGGGVGDGDADLVEVGPPIVPDGSRFSCMYPHSPGPPHSSLGKPGHDVPQSSTST